MLTRNLHSKDPNRRLLVTPELVSEHMGSFLVPSNLPPEGIGKDRLGLNPSALASTRCKTVLSPLAVGEVSMEVTVSP